VGRDTSISWTHSTLNLGYGCRKVDDACANCYMFRLSKEWGIDPNKIQTYDLAKRERELNRWPLNKKNKR